MTVPAQINHDELAQSRIATQYQESAKFRAYIRALVAQSSELETLLFKLAEISDLDLAGGVNLDVIGDIVGISRIIPHAIPIAYFGFDALGGLVYGEEGNISLGGRFHNEGEATSETSVLSDIEYRLLIRAKIIKNHSLGTIEDVIAGLTYLFDNSPSIVEDSGGMAMGVYIGRPITYVERAILDNLDILPRPAGVRINARGYYNYSAYFGFTGQPNALGFWNEIASAPFTAFDLDFAVETVDVAGDISLGGIFMEEF